MYAFRTASKLAVKASAAGAASKRGEYEAVFAAFLEMSVAHRNFLVLSLSMLFLSPPDYRHCAGTYKVPDARHVAYHDRGWYRQLEKEGRRGLQCR